MRKYLMNKAKFSKPPLTDEEKEKKLEAFINLLEGPTKHKEEQKKTRPKKEKVRPLYLRVPESLWEDIHEIMARTGLSMNAICLELLRPEVRQKLKNLKED